MILVRRAEGAQAVGQALRFDQNPLLQRQVLRGPTARIGNHASGNGDAAPAAMRRFGIATDALKELPRELKVIWLLRQRSLRGCERKGRRDDQSTPRGPFTPAAPAPSVA